MTGRYGVFVAHIGGGAGWGIYLRDRMPQLPPPHRLDALLRVA